MRAKQKNESETRDLVGVANCYTLTPEKKKTSVRVLAEAVGAELNCSTVTRWIIAGDLNTTEGVLQKEIARYCNATVD